MPKKPVDSEATDGPMSGFLQSAKFAVANSEDEKISLKKVSLLL